MKKNVNISRYLLLTICQMNSIGCHFNCVKNSGNQVINCVSYVDMIAQILHYKHIGTYNQCYKKCLLVFIEQSIMRIRT